MYTRHKAWTAILEDYEEYAKTAQPILRQVKAIKLEDLGHWFAIPYDDMAYMLPSLENHYPNDDVTATPFVKQTEVYICGHGYGAFVEGDSLTRDTMKWHDKNTGGKRITDQWINYKGGLNKFSQALWKLRYDVRDGADRTMRRAPFSQEQYESDKTYKEEWDIFLTLQNVADNLILQARRIMQWCADACESSSQSLADKEKKAATTEECKYYSAAYYNWKLYLNRMITWVYLLKYLNYKTFIKDYTKIEKKENVQNFRRLTDNHYSLHGFIPVQPPKPAVFSEGMKFLGKEAFSYYKELPIAKATTTDHARSHYRQPLKIKGWQNFD